jgi:Mn-containing catalase
MGGMDVQHAIVAGAGARPVDSNGNPWQGSYITASGNLLADFTANANAEMQGRVQAARIYNMTDDHGVRDLLSFLIARDTMHQNQWIRAVQELREEGVEDLPVPSNFPISQEHRDVSYQYINFSDGETAAEGSWASGPTPDGKGEFTYLSGPESTVPMPPPTQPDPRLFGTDPKPNIVDKAAGVVKDKLSQK